MSVDHPVQNSDDNNPPHNNRILPVEVFSSIRCILGEGPAWDADSESLFWVDIRGHKVYVANADGAVKHSWSTPAQPSAVVLTSCGNVLVPAGQEVLLLRMDTGELHPFAQLSGEPTDNRCNDAKCDPMGNLWIGTMDDKERNKTGRLWRFISGGGETVVVDGIGVPNTLAWDLLRGRFYFADSMAGDIYVFDYDPVGSKISRRKTFFRRDSAPGVPDGSAIDEEGYLWNARWDGGCVVRISPDGEMDRVIKIPARRPTSCAFGGADMKTLFVTSAISDQSASPDRDDQGGALFCIKVDVAGSSIPRYEGPVAGVVAC